MSTRIGLLYGHVASNLGDLAINTGLCRYLARTYDDCSLKVVFLNAARSEHLPKAQESFSGLDEIEFVNFSSSTRRAHRYALDPAQFFDDLGLADHDLILHHPGEHLFSYTAWNNSHSLLWRTLPALAAKLSGKCFIVLPSTFGPFETPSHAAAVSAMLRLADAVAAREPISARTLEAELGLPPPVVLPDLGFFLDAPRPRTSPEKTPALGLVMRVEQFGMRVGRERSAQARERYEGTGFDDTQSLAFAVELIERFTQAHQGTVRIFIQTAADQELARAIRTRAKDRAPSASVATIKPASVADYVNNLAELDYVVAARFHAVVLGLTAGVPVLGVHFSEHGPKMPGLFEWLDAPQLSFPISMPDPRQAAVDVVANLPTAADSLPRIASRVQEERTQAEHWLQATEAKPVCRPELVAGLSAIGGLAGGLGELLDGPTSDHDSPATAPEANEDAPAQSHARATR